MNFMMRFAVTAVFGVWPKLRASLLGFDGRSGWAGGWRTIPNTLGDPAATVKEQKNFPERNEFLIFCVRRKASTKSAHSQNRVHLDTVLALLPLPARHERGEGRGEGLFVHPSDPPLPCPLPLSLLLPPREERERISQNENSVKMHPTESSTAKNLPPVRAKCVSSPCRA